MDGLSGTFFRRQVAVLVLSAPLLWAVFYYTSIDVAISDRYYSAALGAFPLRHEARLELWNHQLPRYAYGALFVGALVQAIRTRSARLGWVVLMMGLSPLVVGALKYTSTHSSPWSLTRYGGPGTYYKLFAPVPPTPGPGHGFPGGHASACSSLMAFFFLYYPERPRRAYAWLAGGLVLSQVTGYGQVARGAHFLSHNLWTVWVVWALFVAVAWVAWLRAPAGRPSS